MKKNKTILLTILTLLFVAPVLFLNKKNLKSQVSNLDRRLNLPKTRTYRAVNKTGNTLQRNGISQKELVRESKFNAEVIKARLSGLENYSLKQIRENIDIIEDAIREDPNTYDLYRAKLLFLLALEEKSTEVDYEYEIQSLLDVLASFDLKSDPVLRSEAFVLSRSGQILDNLNNDIQDIRDDLFSISMELESIDKNENSLIYNELLMEKLLFEKIIERKIYEYESKEREVDAGLYNNEFYLNADIINIPLQRSLARKEFDDVIQSSLMLIERYPQEYIGYYYLIMGHMLSGEMQRALDVISDLRLNPLNSISLERRIIKSQYVGGKKYWKNFISAKWK